MASGVPNESSLSESTTCSLDGSAPFTDGVPSVVATASSAPGDSGMLGKASDVSPFSRSKGPPRTTEGLVATTVGRSVGDVGSEPFESSDVLTGGTWIVVVREVGVGLVASSTLTERCPSDMEDTLQRYTVLHAARTRTASSSGCSRRGRVEEIGSERVGERRKQ